MSVGNGAVAERELLVVLYDLLVTHTWWRYNSSDWFHQAYHWFNLVEGLIWLGFAAFVLGRFTRRRRSWLEVAYAAAFFAFGLTDFREAWCLQSWLILFKGANLLVLLWLRHEVIRLWYPSSRVC
jgi:hypothetical protein